VKLGDEVVSWPRAGVTLQQGRGSQPVQVGVAGTVESFNVNLAQNMLALRFPDGSGVTFAYTPLTSAFREQQDAFIRELSSGEGAPPAGPGDATGPAFTP
jgi:hypothetical protein